MNSESSHRVIKVSFGRRKYWTRNTGCRVGEKQYIGEGKKARQREDEMGAI